MRLAYISFLFALFGCGSDLTADQACTHVAEDRCSQLQTCSAADLSRRWPDLATCEAREKLACTEALAAPHTANTPSHVEECGGELVAQACGPFLSGVNPPMACVPEHGTLAVGAACSFAAQCSTGFCSVAPDTLCGACAAPPNPGDSCAAQGCGPIMVCVAATETCAVPSASGAACSASQPCLQGLACVGATQTASGTCMPEATTAGAACDARRQTMADCDAAAGLTCDRSTNTCVSQPLAASGQPCGLVGTTETACSGGATCVRPAGSATGTCVAPAADGAACDSASGPGCEFPARCVPTSAGGTAGTCQLPGSISC